MRSLFVIGMSIAMVANVILLSAEELDRGMVAMQREDGSIFVGWRALGSDTSDNKRGILMRKTNGSDEDPVFFAVQSRNNFLDSDVDTSVGKEYTYSLYRALSRQDAKQSQPVAEAQIVCQEKVKPYLEIPLRGDYDFQKIGVGDLDGDGELEYIIKQPNFNTDPYQQPGYWKLSEDTYKIEAYKQDGTLMWVHDMGWAIEAGIWYSPWLVYDVDGDGKAEVYCKAGEGDPRNEEGRVETGPEYLVKIDGETGEIVAKTDWLPREGYSDYNRYSRNFLTVAYLDGKSPSLIMQRGTYQLIRTRALDKDFNTLWTWDAPENNPKYWGQGSHGLISADVDNDGRDELVIGAAVIDDNGEGLWTLEMGHPDVCYVADIDPDNPGLEIYYGFETRQETDGICLVDAKTGKKLWAHKKPTRHIHGQGMVADLLATHPGMEVYSGERDLAERWLYSSKGELIEFIEKMELAPKALWWDNDPQKEVILNGGVRDWGGEIMQPIEGRVIAVMDILGDHREEVVTSVKGAIRIYTTTIPTNEYRPSLLQDRQYRLGVVAQTMGYYYPAQLGLEK